jgi:hypothetical protein
LRYRSLTLVTQFVRGAHPIARAEPGSSIYRSILAQSKDYVTVLERINAVGMAVQVINNIPDRSADRRDAAMADLANKLLGLYATLPTAQISKAE